MGFLFEQIKIFIVYTVIIGFTGLLISIGYNYIKETGYINFRSQTYYKESKAPTKSQKESAELCKVGMQYLNAGNYSKAIEIFKKAIDKNCYNDKAYAGAGIASYHKKRYEESIRYLRHSVRLNNKNLKVFLTLADIHERKANYKLAIKYNKKALLLDSKNNVAKQNLLRIRSKLSSKMHKR